MNDTIFAPATASGRGAVAIVRISGPAAADVVRSAAGGLPPPRRASFRRLRRPDGEILDEALALWMPGPASFTGEDCAEFHLHGGAAVVAGVLELLTSLGLRLAEPGEFTRRAFANGRLDLAQAEAVADLVAAETGGQRRQALAQLDGALSRRYEAWRERLLDALAYVEAEVDFPDEEIPDEIRRSADVMVSAVLQELCDAAGDLHGERVRDGWRVALVGAPNVGKSSLLNALVGRDAAIVTPTPGTTRDVVEIPIVLGGQTVVLADTAGLREPGEDAIEAEGVRRARAWAQSADLRLGVMDASRGDTLADAAEALGAADILVVNKADLGVSADTSSALQTVRSSTVKLGGVDALRAALAQRVEEMSGSEFPAVTRSRHRGLLLEAVGHLRRNEQVGALAAELRAENIRLALRELERVTGRINPEAVLDRVFSSFCIGK